MPATGLVFSGVGTSRMGPGLQCEALDIMYALYVKLFNRPAGRSLLGFTGVLCRAPAR